MSYPQRIINISDEKLRGMAALAITHLPCDQNLQIVIREKVDARTLSQNALMWSGALKDISEQAWENGCQYSENGWHEVFKILYMPDENTALNIYKLVKKPETYRKWEYLPNGDRRCCASTTDLTKQGFGMYMDQIYAFGGSKGVLFSASPKQLNERGH